MSGTTTDFELKASEVGQLIQKFKTNVKSMKRMLHYVDNNKESLRYTIYRCNRVKSQGIIVLLFVNDSPF